MHYLHCADVGCNIKPYQEAEAAVAHRGELEDMLAQLSSAELVIVQERIEWLLAGRKDEGDEVLDLAEAGVVKAL